MPWLLENVSDMTLGMAYFKSAAFYIRLLAAFVLRGLGNEFAIGADTLVTLVLAYIGLRGAAVRLAWA